MCLCCKVGTVHIPVPCKGGALLTAERPEVLERTGLVVEGYAGSGGRRGKIEAGGFLLEPRLKMMMLFHLGKKWVKGVMAKYQRLMHSLQKAGRKNCLTGQLEAEQGTHPTVELPCGRAKAS